MEYLRKLTKFLKKLKNEKAKKNFRETKNYFVKTLKKVYRKKTSKEKL